VLERSLAEVKRRTKVIGRFPGETSCLTLVWAVLDLYITNAKNGVRFSELERQRLKRMRYEGAEEADRTRGGDSGVAILNNRVPSAVLLLELFGAALAVGLLTAYFVLSGRGIITVSFASILVVLVLFVIADLDRPTRGEIQVPDTVLVDQLESMQKPPAAAAPKGADAAPARP
jgi:hypothetical protein